MFVKTSGLRYLGKNILLAERQMFRLFLLLIPSENEHSLFIYVNKGVAGYSLFSYPALGVHKNFLNSSCMSGACACPKTTTFA